MIILVIFFSIKKEGFDKVFPVEPYAKEIYQDDDIYQDPVEKKREEKKDSWNNPYDFLFQAVSYCVGLGAFWRFPYVASLKN